MLQHTNPTTIPGATGSIQPPGQSLSPPCPNITVTEILPSLRGDVSWWGIQAAVARHVTWVPELLYEDMLHLFSCLPQQRQTLKLLLLSSDFHGAPSEPGDWWAWVPVKSPGPSFGTEPSALLPPSNPSHQGSPCPLLLAHLPHSCQWPCAYTRHLTEPLLTVPAARW